MKGYLKCVVGNRCTLCGFIFLGSGLILLMLGPLLNSPIALPNFICILWIFGFMLLGVSMYGLETYRAYKRTMSHIKEFGRVDKRYKSRYSLYCGRVGVRLAMKEMGLKKE